MPVRLQRSSAKAPSTSADAAGGAVGGRADSGKPGATSPAAADGFDGVGAGAPPSLRRAVDRVVAQAAQLRRSDGPEGVERWLTKLEIERVGVALDGMPTTTAAMLQTWLRDLDSPIKRGLLLRAVAARASTMADAAVPDVLGRFVKRLTAMADQEVRRRATVTDLDSTMNDRQLAPVKLWEKRGTIYDPSRDDDRGDNDGLIQRFTASCGPTTLQILLAEADPVVAFAIHDDDVASDATDDTAASFQADMLRRAKGVVLGRREAQLRSRLNNATGRLDDEDQRDAVRRYALKGGRLTLTAKEGIAALRDRFRGFPTQAELERVRRSPLPATDKGTSADDFAELLNEIVGSRTGVTYRQTTPAHGFARGQGWRHLDDVARALRRGVDVPFGLCEPGHWMCLTAVKGRKPKRSFLAVDPWSGRTAWVDERSLVRGTFADTQFNLSGPTERPYIDSFFLPA